MRFKSDRQRKAVMTKFRKIIDGKRYALAWGYLDKKEADRIADIVRYAGCPSKVVKYKGKYDVYTRPEASDGWVVFKKGNKPITKISVKGLFPGEASETRKLIARRNNVSPSKIKVEVEE